MPKVKLNIRSGEGDLVGEFLQIEIPQENNQADRQFFEDILPNWNNAEDNYAIVKEKLVAQDLLFEYKNNYYLISHADSNFDSYFNVISKSKKTFPSYTWISPTYAKRNKLFEENAIKQIDMNYTPGWWFTGAPAVAGGLTLAPLINDQLQTVFATSSLMQSVLIVPFVAAAITLPATYAMNWLHYKLANDNASLPQRVRDKIWQDSCLRSSQVFAALSMVEGVKLALEPLFNTALENAWGGAIKIGGAIAPAEIKAAVMLSVSVAAGLGMALGLALYQAYRKHYYQENFNFTQIGVALITGCVVGAVSTIDFGNQGFSFLATWASLCLFPVLNTVTPEGRQEMKENVKETGLFFGYMADKLTPDCATLAEMSEGMQYMPNMYAPGLPPM